MTTDFQALPRLGEVFEQLRRGRHLDPEEGPLYQALVAHEDGFAALFTRLGFDLRRHARGFYYFEGTGTLSDTGERMALFVLIVIEWLADRPGRVEEQFMSRVFALDELPHLQQERYRGYLQQVRVETPEDLGNIVNALDRYGFARKVDDGRFQFRTPAYRFFDLCYDALTDEEERPDDLTP